MPGVQKPHCRPCSCQKPSWSGWSLPSCSSPSTVMICAPVGLHREDRARLHRPAVEQHRAGAAVRGVAADVGAGQPQVSRRRWTSSRRGSTSRLVRSPLTVTQIRPRASADSARRPSPRARRRAAKRARRQHPHHLPLVLDGAAQVAPRLALAGRRAPPPRAIAASSSRLALRNASASVALIGVGPDVGQADAGAASQRRRPPA